MCILENVVDGFAFLLYDYCTIELNTWIYPNTFTVRVTDRQYCYLVWSSLVFLLGVKNDRGETRP